MMKTIAAAGLLAGSILVLGSPAIEPVHGIKIERVVAPGDTMNYGARWPKWRGATRYIYSVRASTAGWTLPTNVSTTDTSATLRLSHLTPWDTVTFRLVVKGANNLGVSKDSTHVSWKAGRPLTPPANPPVIDSVNVVLKLTP